MQKIFDVLHTSTRIGVDVESQDVSLDRFVEDWRLEVGRRFPNAYVVLAHGGNEMDGVWTSSAQSFRHFATVRELAERARRLHPGRPIVLVCCNPGHLPLHLPGVWHASSNVWLEPDRAVIDATMSATLDSPTNVVPIPLPPLPFFPGLPFLQHPPEEPLHLRWDVHPDYVGNIFEFNDE